MERPNHFWKYRSIDGNLQRILERQELWFASAASFNDPYDCAPVIETRAPAAVVRAHFSRIFMATLAGTARQKRRKQKNLVMKDNPFFKPGFVGSPEGDAYVAEVIDAVIAKTGVLSLSAVSSNVLMWSHYANSHRGVALGFNYFSDLLKHAEPVRYSHERPIINFFLDQRSMIEKAVFTKAEYWSYEQEWRVLARNHLGAQLYDPRDLSLIVFGAKCPPDDQDRVRTWARAGGLLPAYFQEVFDSRTFGLRREPLPS